MPPKFLVWANRYQVGRRTNDRIGFCASIKSTPDSPWLTCTFAMTMREFRNRGSKSKWTEEARLNPPRALTEPIDGALSSSNGKCEWVSADTCSLHVGSRGLLIYGVGTTSIETGNDLSKVSGTSTINSLVRKLYSWQWHNKNWLESHKMKH